jgi:hypothetical protein
VKLPRSVARLTVASLFLLSGVVVGCQTHHSVTTAPSSPMSTAQALTTSTTSAIAPSDSDGTPSPTVTSIPQPTTTAPIALAPTPLARAYSAPPIEIPANYRSTFTHYATVDRTDSGGAVRVMYITPGSIHPFQATGVFPIGTMVIMEVYQVQQDSNGGFATDASGHLIPGRLQSVLVKLKTGTTATPASGELAADVNQRGWVYASFDATTGAVDGLDQPLCQSCHVTAQDWDDLFTRPELLAFAQSDAPQYLLCQFAGRQPCQEPPS